MPDVKRNGGALKMVQIALNIFFNNIQTLYCQERKRLIILGKVSLHAHIQKGTDPVAGSGPSIPRVDDWYYGVSSSANCDGLTSCVRKSPKMTRY